MPEGSVPEGSVPEGSVPEGGPSVPEGSVPEGSVPEGFVPARCCLVARPQEGHAGASVSSDMADYSRKRLPM